MAELKKLSVAIAAGGTAGHINPALALAEELRERGHQVTFYGQPNKLEGTLVPEAGFELVPIHVNGFDRRRPWTLISAAYNLERAKSQLHKRFREQELLMLLLALEPMLSCHCFNFALSCTSRI